MTRSAHRLVPLRLAARGGGLLAGMLLAACVSSGGMHTHAQPVDAATLQGGRSLAAVPLSAAAWPRAQWWHAYGDGQLDQLITTALAGQPGLRIAEARVRLAQSLAVVAGATLQPQVGAGLENIRQRFSENATAPKPLAGSWNSTNNLVLGAHYDLDLWGANRAALEASVDRAHAAEVDLQASRLMLATGVVRLYLGLDSAYTELDLDNETLRQDQQTLRLTRQRVGAQIDSQLQLVRAEASIPPTRQRIAAIHESIALLRNQIAALEGKGPDAGLDLRRPHLAPGARPVLPSHLPSELIGRRPDVVAARWRVEAAGNQVRSARARFYPNISLNAFVGLQSLGLDAFLAAGSRVAGIGPAISLPIFDGGRLRGNLGMQQAGYDIAVEHYNATVIGAVHDVVDQLVSLKSLQQQTIQQDQALRLAREARDLATRRYREGLAGYLQVLVASGQVLVRQRQAVALQARRRELELELVRALGGGYEPTRSTPVSAPRSS